jgi:DegV family protein with EDD domain
VTVAVVTDSTADLPSDLAEVLGLRVVPMSVQFGERTYISRITITDAEFYERLATTDELPSTSQPAPAWFEEAYADADDDGADAVVSLHVSAELSGTVELAQRLGRDAPLDVHVVDSRQVGGGLALQVLAAHDAARRGGSVEDVIAAAEAVRDAVRTYVVVDTLEHLRKGGRLTGAQALVGSMLRVKPVLHLTEGRVEVLERARTWNRALDRLADLAADALGDDEPGHLVVTHSVAPERAAELWDRLTARIAVQERLEAVIGPVVGTHTGPGAVSVSVVPARLTTGTGTDEG